MRILIVCDDYKLPTGLARVGRKIFEFLKQVYEVYYLPTGHDFGRGGFAKSVRELKPDWVLSIGDIFHFEYMLGFKKDFRWFLYSTIDAMNFMGRLPTHWVKIMALADIVGCPSKFGCQLAEIERGIEIPYLPYGTEIGLESKATRSRKENQPDRQFSLLFVNRNSFRKHLPDALKVARRLKNVAKNKEYDRIGLYLHSTDEFYDIQNLIADYELDNLVSSSLNPVTEDSLSRIYAQAANGRGVHIYPSGAEGFGLTALESMSCHVPVIASNYSAMSETANILLDPVGFQTQDEGVEHAIFDVDACVEQVVKMYHDFDYAFGLSLDAYHKSLKFQWNETLEKMRDILSDHSDFKDTIQPMISNRLDVSLFIQPDIAFRENTYYPVQDVNFFDKEIDFEKVTTRYVAIVNHSIPQRGWLTELARLMRDNVAVVGATTIGIDSRVTDGEFYVNDEDDIFFLREGQVLGAANHDAFSFPFYTVLIDLDKLVPKPDMELRVSGMEYCIRAHEKGYQTVISSRAIALVRERQPYDEQSMKRFRAYTQWPLNQMTAVVYRGPRPKIYTHFGFLERDQPIEIQAKRAFWLKLMHKNIERVPKKMLHAAMADNGSIKIGRNAGLGDVIMALLFGASALKKANPTVNLTFVTNAAYCSFVRDTGLVDEVLDYPMGMSSNLGYDYVHDLSAFPENKDPASKQCRPDLFAEHLGSYSGFEYEAYQPTMVARAKELLPETDRPRVGIQAIASSQVRVYPPDYMAELVQRLIEAEYDVVLFGVDHGWRLGYSNWNGKHLVSFVDQIAEIEMNASLMSQCDYFIAPDSGLLHLAGFMKLPTLALFGNIPPENRIKYYPTVRALYPKDELSCIPCGDIYNPCPESNGKFSGKCMRLLTPDRVVEALQSIINGDDIPIEPIANSQPLTNAQTNEIIQIVDLVRKRCFR